MLGFVRVVLCCAFDDGVYLLDCGNSHLLQRDNDLLE